ncbi:MFS transporter [Actinotignum schaalii]
MSSSDDKRPATPAAESEDTSAQFAAAHPDTFAQYLRRRGMVFFVAYLGYVCAYLVRNNFKLRSEALRLENDWSLPQIGLVLTMFTITYGFGKFFMGMLSDRVSLRRIFAGCLGLSAVLCVAIGFTTNFYLLAVLMFLLGCAQGALAPSSMAMIANWYPNKTRGSGIAIWNTSQNLGGALLPLMITWLLALGGPSGGAIAFWGPGLVVFGLSIFFWKYGGDRPEAEGMPTLRQIYGKAGEPNTDETPDESYWHILVRWWPCRGISIIPSRSMPPSCAIRPLPCGPPPTAPWTWSMSKRAPSSMKVTGCCGSATKKKKPLPPPWKLLRTAPKWKCPASPILK